MACLLYVKFVRVRKQAETNFTKPPTNHFAGPSVSGKRKSRFVVVTGFKFSPLRGKRAHEVIHEQTCSNGEDNRREQVLNMSITT